MNRRTRRATKPGPQTKTIVVMVPKVLDAAVWVAVEIEDAGFSAETGCYVTRITFNSRTITNEFDPAGVPFGKVPVGRHATNIALLRRFGLDLTAAVGMAS